MSFLAKLKPRIRTLPGGVNPYSYEAMLATWFGSGRITPASGTVGSLAAIPFGYAISYCAGPFGLLTAALLLLWAGSIAAGSFTKKAGVKDDQTIVIDEVVGMFFAAIPAETNIGLWALAFLLFRIFDIYKPWPASYFDNRGKNGFDILFDDVIAGLFAFMGVASVAVYLAMTGKM